MKLGSQRKSSVLLIICGLVLLAVILALMAPEEKTLGSYIRLIYIHAAVTWIGLIMFVLSAIFASFYFLAGSVKTKMILSLKEKMLKWSSASQLTAMLFWTASVSIGAIAAYLTWGGNWWIEPRLRVAVFILLLAFFAYQARGIVSTNFSKALVNFGMPVGAFLLLVTTGKLVHPNNAFAKSDSIQIKLFAILITLVFAGVAFVSTRYFINREIGDKAIEDRN